MGSPPEELYRGEWAEIQVTITLSRSFEVMQTEVTWKDWYDAGFEKPGRHPADDAAECLDPSCPAANVSWNDAVAFANRYSELRGLSVCYDLAGCTGTVGVDFDCPEIDTTAPTLYECAGYRLPTEFEWEYAARAGVQTAFLGGRLAESAADLGAFCRDEPNLAPYAWYCDNSQNVRQEVGQRCANGWGLHDVLGNSKEWTNDSGGQALPTEPATDPRGVLEASSTRVYRGGAYFGYASMLRLAERLDVVADYNADGQGLRLVRTLPETP